MKKLLVVFLLLFLTRGIFADTIVNLEQDYTATDLYEMALQLEATYPALIHVEIIGRSTDGRPIFVIQMTSGLNEVENVNAFYTSKMHFLIEGGIHSRENVSSPMLMKIVENYARDYYDESVLAGIPMGDMLHENVFHFIILSNPDGYDLANFGLKMIGSPYKEKLLTFNYRNYSQYKSNVNGVDLNRNFPGLYYDLNEGQFKDIWNKVHNDYRSYIPGAAFYFGPYEASELETQALMAYLTAYDFRNYISFHSKGEVIYWYKWMLSESHNYDTKILALQVSKVNGYERDYNGKADSSSGYLTDFTAMTTLKPSITIETVDWRHSLPTHNSDIIEAYYLNYKVPAVAALEGKRVGYFDNKLYKDGVYIRDFRKKAYADAWAEQLDGQVFIYEGRPVYQLPDHLRKITRKEAVSELIKTLNLSYDAALKPFDDCDDEDVLKARGLNIISGYENHFYPDKAVNYEEAYVILYNAMYKGDIPSKVVDYLPRWAELQVNALVANGVILPEEVKTGEMMKSDFLNLLERIKK